MSLKSEIMSHSFTFEIALYLFTFCFPKDMKGKVTLFCTLIFEAVAVMANEKGVQGVHCTLALGPEGGLGIFAYIED